MRPHRTDRPSARGVHTAIFARREPGSRTFTPLLTWLLTMAIFLGAGQKAWAEEPARGGTTSSDSHAADARKEIETYTERVEKLRKAAQAFADGCEAKDAAAAYQKTLVAEIRSQIWNRIELVGKQIRDLKGRKSKNAAKAADAFDNAIDTELERLGKESDNLSELSKGLEEAVKKELDKRSACESFCPKAGDKTMAVSFCALSDPVLANAAVIADVDSVDRIAEHVRQPWTTLEKRFSVDLDQQFPRIGGARRAAPKSQRDEKASPAGFAMGAPAAGAALGGLAGLDLTAVSARTAEVALAALAKVVADRAKRESLVWFLEQMHQQVCGAEQGEDCGADEECQKACSVENEAVRQECQAVNTNPQADAQRCEPARKKLADCRHALKKNIVRREIRTYWLPSTCALAGKRMDYAQYGGGSKLLGALQGAMATDVRRWPGVTAGLGAGAALWVGTPKGDVETLFACDPGSPDGKPNILCEPTLKLRGATAQLTDELIAGANASASFYAYAAALDGLNKHKENGVALHSTPLQMAACTMSLPLVFQQYEERVKATKLGQAETVEALLLAGLAGAPACWSIVGKGLELADCLEKPSACKTEHRKVALQESSSLERLSTLREWHGHVHGPARAVGARIGELKTAWDAYLAAVKALKEQGGGAPFVPPPFDPSKVNDAKTFAEVLKAFDAYVKDASRTAQQTQQVKLLQASAALAKASLSFGSTLVDGMAGLTSPDLYPGLCEGAMKTNPFCKGTVLTGEALRKTSQTLAQYARYAAAAESALTQDWGAAIAQIVATVRVTVESGCKEKPECKKLLERLTRYSGLFAALVSEKDPEKVAEALDAAAMPIGGWRQKQVPGAMTVSLSALAGFNVSALEVRWGQYGVHREQGLEPHWAPPSLQLPVGIDVTWGWNRDDPAKSAGSSGIFVSLVDPAAYLQYDPDQGNRLPGAQVLTALAPGVALRTSLWDTPFVASVYGVFRPNFRAWEPGVAVPGAHALQIGASLSVDVTLFEIYSKQPE